MRAPTSERRSPQPSSSGTVVSSWSSGVSEGSLSWQLPAGAVEHGETFAEAAVRETAEETGLVVAAVTTLGERVHPETGRLIGYVACRVQHGEAHVADTDELRDIVWVAPAELSGYVPRGFATVVQDYLVVALG
ncbi:NUDIX hydrolase [Promicromonospora sp. NPDC050249]|uniref:NUDIX hydrolase n=1 Tax=Promicromonospora sp. NPDC050249 TaxID=3154743 RepID=UPI003407E5B1